MQAFQRKCKTTRITFRHDLFTELLGHPLISVNSQSQYGRKVSAEVE